MGSKLFKTYAYLIALKYLWVVLARVINEIDTITKESLKKAQQIEEEGEKGASLLKLEMEVRFSSISLIKGFLNK
jgi:hypothetical protein